MPRLHEHSLSTPSQQAVSIQLYTCLVCLSLAFLYHCHLICSVTNHLSPRLFFSHSATDSARWAVRVWRVLGACPVDCRGFFCAHGRLEGPMSASHAVIATAAHAPVCSTELCPVRVIHSWKVSCDDSWWRGRPWGQLGSCFPGALPLWGLEVPVGCPHPEMLCPSRPHGDTAVNRAVSPRSAGSLQVFVHRTPAVPLQPDAWRLWLWPPDPTSRPA